MTGETPDQRRYREHRDERAMTCVRVAKYIWEGGVVTDEVSEAISALATACSAAEDDAFLDDGRGPGDPMPGDNKDD